MYNDVRIVYDQAVQKTGSFGLMLAESDPRFIAVIPAYSGQDKIHLLYDFNLVQPSDVPCNRLNVTHGSVLLNLSQPIHVPGETIPVLCDSGYGVKTEEGYSQYFTTVCSRNMVTPRCTNISSGREFSVPLRVTFFTANSVVACCLIYLACARWRKSKHHDERIEEGRSQEITE